MLVLATALFAGKHLLVLLVLTATAWVAGRTALRRLDSGEGWERLAVPAALGLTVLAHLFLALGFCGLLSRGPVLLVVAAVHGLGYRAWGEATEALRGKWRRAGGAAGLLAALAPLFVFALFPPTAFDETLYHLPYAKAFARSGGVPFLPDLRSPVFPQLEEILQAAVLLLAGDVATHLVQLLAVLLTAALLAGWGLRMVGPAAGWLAAGLFLGSPIVIHLAGTGYVEPGLTLFATAAVHSLARWHESRHAGWLALAAVFTGSAGGVKYLGLYFVGVVLLAVLPVAVRERRWRDLLLTGLVMLAVLAPWYGRILYYTGNPIFPFFPDLFPAPPTPWDPGGLPVLRSPEERVLAFLRLPWDVVLNRPAVGYQPPFSPAFLLGLPLLALGLVREARVRWLLAVVAGYALIFLLLPPDARYLVAVLPLLSLALALSLGSSVASRVSLRLTAALALAVFLPGWLYAGYRIWLQGPVPATARAREEYLVRQLPVYPALRFLNRSQGDRYTVYAFHAESMTYFADGRFLGDWNGPARFARVQPLVPHSEALWRELRRLGVTHLLVTEGRGIRPPEGDPAFRRLFRRVYSDSTSVVYALSPTDPRSPAAPSPPRSSPRPGR